MSSTTTPKVDLATADSCAGQLTWDDFLEACPLGQYQQTLRWGRAKQSEGWRPVQVWLDANGENRGGFQLLWKHSRFGRIGYVSKGPVLQVETPEAIQESLVAIVRAANEHRLRALILQPPDGSSISPTCLCQYGFSPLPLPSIISATLLVELRGGPERVEAQMSRTFRREARRAIKREMSVFTGGREHLRQFFSLMQATCRRQRTQPNPSNLTFLETLWDQFFPSVRVSFARIGEELVAGLFLIGFGERMTFWKKGWSATSDSANANSLLHVTELKWAAAQGYRWADFSAINRGIAERLLEGKELTEAQQHSRDGFNLRLGGRPALLPPALIRISSPAFRSVFNRLAGFRLGSAMIRRLISSV